MKDAGYENCKTFLKFKIRWKIKKLHYKYSRVKRALGAYMNTPLPHMETNANIPEYVNMCSLKMIRQ